MRPTKLVLMMLAACTPAGAPPPATASAEVTAPAPAPESTATPAPPPPPPSPPATATPPAPLPPPAPEARPIPVGPVPIGGSVLLGDIDAPKGFAPKAVLSAQSARLVQCFNEARSYEPTLHGKLLLRIIVGENGSVISVDADRAGTAYHQVLIECIDGALKGHAHFTKPGGTATISAPLVFRP